MHVGGSYPPGQSLASCSRAFFFRRGFQLALLNRRLLLLERIAGQSVQLLQGCLPRFQVGGAGCLELGRNGIGLAGRPHGRQRDGSFGDARFGVIAFGDAGFGNAGRSQCPRAVPRPPAPVAFRRACHPKTARPPTATPRPVPTTGRRRRPLRRRSANAARRHGVAPLFRSLCGDARLHGRHSLRCGGGWDVDG